MLIKIPKEPLAPLGELKPILLMPFVTYVLDKIGIDVENQFNNESMILAIREGKDIELTIDVPIDALSIASTYYNMVHSLDKTETKEVVKLSMQIRNQLL